jgi:hypothetical protein
MPLRYSSIAVATGQDTAYRTAPKPRDGDQLPGRPYSAIGGSSSAALAARACDARMGNSDLRKRLDQQP